ncbi:MAG TPA: carboxypeptidase-like regulatory domain-containing protein [Chthoniobacterales bacterium]|nr:carboxypeptidase-like regulatory domain-containing protein [Chthoniobacterales bacterium]
MRPRSFFIILAAVSVLVCGSVAVVRGQFNPPIYGQVISQSRGPVAGITVSLVHPTLGRSTPVFTQQNGSYFFANVPPGQTYYIEAYWGNTLLYRGVVNYYGGSVAFNIPLP